MVRVQIRLTEAQSARLKVLAAGQSISVAETVRRAVDAALSCENLPDEDELRQRALAVVGAFETPENDVSERHDAYLAEAFRS